MDPLLAKTLTERERRFRRRTELVAQGLGTVVQLTITAPGIRKDGDDIRRAAQWGAALLELRLSERTWAYEKREWWDGDTGPCGFWVIFAPPMSVKGITVGLEEGYSLGRLWDFDVYGPGNVKLDRESMGSDPRKCFICGEPAAICAGRRLHSPEEVAKRFQELLQRGMEELETKGVFV